MHWRREGHGFDGNSCGEVQSIPEFETCPQVAIRASSRATALTANGRDEKSMTRTITIQPRSLRAACESENRDKCSEKVGSPECGQGCRSAFDLPRLLFALPERRTGGKMSRGCRCVLFISLSQTVLLLQMMRDVSGMALKTKEFRGSRE